MTETREISTIEQIGLHGLIQKYRSQIDTGAERIGLSERAKKAAVVVSGGILTTGVILGPAIAEGMARGLNLPESVVFALGSLPLSGTWEHIDPENAREIVTAISHSEPAQGIEAFTKELPKFGTEYRALLFEAGLLAGVVAGIDRLFHKREKRERNIREGSAKIKRDGEQLFVLAGQSSNIADALTIADPAHTVPIYENAQGGKYLLSREEDKVKKGKPVFLNLDIDEQAGITYRKSKKWDKLVVREENLVHAPNGNRYLVVVGCGEKAEEELTDKPEFVDVNQEEVHSSVDKLKKSLQSGVTVNDQEVVTVYLGSAKTPQIDDETGKLTTTDRDVAKKGGISIYVDTWSTIVGEIKRKLVLQGLEETGIRLISSVLQYRELMEKVAKDLRIPYRTKEEDGENPTLLVYEEISDETINKAKRLREEYPARNIIALTSNLEADEQARKEGIPTICTATVVRDIIGAIVLMLKQGKTPVEIQQILDQNTSI